MKISNEGRHSHTRRQTRLDGVDRYFSRMESQAAAMIRQIEGGLASVEHVEPIGAPATDPGAVKPRPPAVRGHDGAAMATSARRGADQRGPLSISFAGAS